MLPIGTIVHPTDFSERSAYAFGLACALARDHGARLIVLHVLPLPLIAYGGGPFPEDPEPYRERAREQLGRLRSDDPRVRVEHRLAEGDAAAEILHLTRQEPCHLIVMGTHGRTGMGRVLMGSVAEQVVRQAPCPVLTVRLPFPGPSPAEGPASVVKGATS